MMDVFDKCSRTQQWWPVSYQWFIVDRIGRIVSQQISKCAFLSMDVWYATVRGRPPAWVCFIGIQWQRKAAAEITVGLLLLWLTQIFASRSCLIRKSWSDDDTFATPNVRIWLFCDNSLLFPCVVYISWPCEIIVMKSVRLRRLMATWRWNQWNRCHQNVRCGFFVTTRYCFPAFFTFRDHVKFW